MFLEVIMSTIDGVKVLAGRSINRIGSMSGQKFSGLMYAIPVEGGRLHEYTRYVLDVEGRVWLSREGVRVTDPAVVSRVRTMRDEDLETADARMQYAVALSDGCEDLAEVLGWHLWFCDGSMMEPIVEEGISFYQMGRNASHSFYAGVKDGKRFTMSCGDDDYDDDAEEWISSYHVVEVTDGWGYMGHS